MSYKPLSLYINMGKNKEVEVLFRKIIPDIPSTTYATHGLYMYPAKFIPQVVRFAIEQYTHKEDWVFDPFAGYGTVAIEATLTGRNYIVWDLNPILNIFVKASTFNDDITESDLTIDFNYDKKFKPRWKNLNYWHPPEFIDALSRAWGFFHFEMEDKYKPLAAIALMKLTRYFSYGDEKIAKLYKSRYAKKKVEELLNTNWKTKMENMYEKEKTKIVKKVEEYRSLNPKPVIGKVKAGVDSLTEALEHDVKLLITSPPYLQAQEYIRSFKLELFWLGFSEKKISELSRLEIPYRKTPNVRVCSKTYEKYRRLVNEISNNNLLKIYDCYFKSLILFLNRNHDKIDTMAIFVGPVKIRRIRIPIDQILKEHLESLGWTHDITFIDKIVSRRLFKHEINPATGLPDERTPTEHLLIMIR